MVRLVCFTVGASLYLFVGVETPAQKKKGSFVQIRNVNSGKVLAVPGDASDNGDKVIQLPYGKEPKEGHLERQQWKLTEVDTEVQTFMKDGMVYQTKVAFFKIINRKSGKALQVPENANDDGVPLQQWDYKGGRHQQWSIDKFDKHVVIRSRQNGKAVDVFGGDKASGAKVVQWTPGGADNVNQAFTLEPVK